MIRRPLLAQWAVLVALALSTGAALAEPTAAQARSFIQAAETRLEDLAIRAQRAQWVADNFITVDTELISSQASEQLIKASGELALAARRFKGLKLGAIEARKLGLLQLSGYLSQAADRERLTRLLAGMNGAYGRGKSCPQDGPLKPATPGDCLDLGALEQVMAESRDPAALKQAWLGWHEVARSYKDDYVAYTALANQGARAMGYRDNGALWRSGYDMPEQAFAADMERLWRQVQPLYAELLRYARFKLRQTYGRDLVPAQGPIPAHLFGNLWSQSWEYLYPLLRPEGSAPGFDLSRVLAQRPVSPKEMVRIGEGFYTSLGLEPLPPSFWERSLFVKPQDREVVCHASAWNLTESDDPRIKMCIRPTDEDFLTIHHELGHVYYDLAYRQQSKLFRAGANDGFHEAIGDTVALSVTPDYLRQIGLMSARDPAGDDIDALLKQALQKIAFLPFAYLVDQWRWQVYGGQVKPEDFDASWWRLREQVQGVSRPEPARPGGFDAGAKYHVASDTSYARYFLAHLLQFQFHRALCREARQTGPLHRCSIFGSRAAGAKFQAMLQMGASKPWPEALQALTGERQVDGGALIEYFAPLQTWLGRENARLQSLDPEVRP
ncbi:peptidyl-dipeptidase A [Inhella inkyongensis]|uniref:Peptidyl-dipeptidase A n=1 Tax=Inhella inkyongensis TaxID=392593 RepID=A0A840S0N7_9BURK|nr:M2 family metallopeptidase [Inhella inkyongensis]MBB5203825.1 peptidyl-dipeptidase A [Inhella inkyongensis]